MIKRCLTAGAWQRVTLLCEPYNIYPTCHAYYELRTKDEQKSTDERRKTKIKDDNRWTKIALLGHRIIDLFTQGQRNLINAVANWLVSHPVALGTTTKCIAACRDGHRLAGNDSERPDKLPKAKSHKAAFCYNPQGTAGMSPDPFLFCG